ncbi:VOC family protein [Rheinheimera marina]|uniref:VOC family protein n=1 Tax=Rheinheimera marina TaxID=1774958 RepID=A0ABV9JLE0_9GAMM
MQRVTGIGGVFFKAKDPKALAAWYQTHLGVPLEDWGGAVFQWKSPDNPSGTGCTVWSPFAADTSYFGSGGQGFMLNFRVADLAALLQLLRDEGCQVDDNTEDSEFGKFGWVTDPEGNRVELWQPPEGR